MSLSQTDKIIIMSALQEKRDKCKKMIKQYPENEFWAERLEQVENAKYNFASSTTWAFVLNNIETAEQNI
jgi:hypothetical protein